MRLLQSSPGVSCLSRTHCVHNRITGTSEASRMPTPGVGNIVRIRWCLEKIPVRDERQLGGRICAVMRIIGFGGSSEASRQACGLLAGYSSAPPPFVSKLLLALVPFRRVHVNTSVQSREATKYSRITIPQAMSTLALLRFLASRLLCPLRSGRLFLLN